MFGAIYAAEGSAPETLLDVAREFSPRIEVCGPREVTLDLSGLERLFGDARTIGEELRRTAADRGLRVRVAIAGRRTAARLLVHAARAFTAREADRQGPPRNVTVIEPGTDAASLAPLPIELLASVANDPNDPNGPNGVLVTFTRWGLRTLGDLAGLPADAVAARLGQEGVRWQRLARGDDPRPLLPAVPEERFEQALDLEWPIDGLEPLSFVLGRLLEPLSAQLERRGRGAAVLHVRLHLVTRAVHERSLQLPAPMRDARALRTLALVDLESHPPPAAIDRVVVAVDPTPGRVVQYSLLTRPLPSPEQLSTLMARLTALIGEGRCGSPVEVDSWQPGACAMKLFAPRDSNVLHLDRPQRHRDTEVTLSQTILSQRPTPKAPTPKGSWALGVAELGVIAGAPQGPEEREENVNGLCATNPENRLGATSILTEKRFSGLVAPVPQRLWRHSAAKAADDVMVWLRPWPRCVSASLWPVEVKDAANQPAVALRRFRFPIPARVRVDEGKPSRVTTDRRGLSGGRVEMCAGPWRTSGGWWADRPDGPHSAGSPPRTPARWGARHRDTEANLLRIEENLHGLCASVPLWPVEVNSGWNRDEWDVTLSDGATYRLFRARHADAWFIEGIVD